METYHYIVRGMVQGVSFRYYTKREADLLKISGIVKNLSDGTVEIYAAGDPASLSSFEDYLRNGPGASMVTEIDKSTVIQEKIFTGFEIIR
ncbi:MAG: acylphosphatase [Acidobacteriota bacterium]